MPVIKERMPNGEISISVTDESGTSVAVVNAFLAYLSARDGLAVHSLQKVSF
jgi:hypothetical protein